MTNVTNNPREIAAIERKLPIVRLRSEAGCFRTDEYYKGRVEGQEWGVKITPSSVHQAFLIWSVLHSLFLHEGIGYDRFIMNISRARTVTVREFLGN